MPIDQNFKVEKKESQEFPPIPKDIYQVELLDVTLQEQVVYDDRNKSEEEQRKENVFSFQFTLLDGKDGDTNLRGRNVWANFIPTYLYISSKKGKNKLYRILEALLGHDMTPEEEATCDTKFINNLIGNQCRVGIEPKTKGEKTYDIVTEYYTARDFLNALTDEEKSKSSVSKNEEELDLDNVKL